MSYHESRVVKTARGPLLRYTGQLATGVLLSCKENRAQSQLVSTSICEPRSSPTVCGQWTQTIAD